MMVCRLQDQVDSSCPDLSCLILFACTGREAAGHLFEQLLLLLGRQLPVVNMSYTIQLSLQTLLALEALLTSPAAQKLCRQKF